jgi:F-type H+-transporting ATPase subunit a
MEQFEHKSYLYHVLEGVFGGHSPVPDHVVMAVFIALFLAGFAFWFRSQIRVENPGKLQLVFETIVGALKGMIVDNIGEKGRPFLGLVGTLGLYILFCNLFGLFPFFSSPTVNLNFTVGCALVAFLYYNYQGIQAQGALNYFKHFLGPLLPLAVIMLPIEIISHFSRIMSLSLRLFGNIFGEELVIAALGTMVAYVVPVPMMLFGVFGSLLQSFVFIMLTMVYIGGAVAIEEH